MWTCPIDSPADLSLTAAGTTNMGDGYRVRVGAELFKFLRASLLPHPQIFPGNQCSFAAIVFSPSMDPKNHLQPYAEPGIRHFSTPPPIGDAIRIAHKNTAYSTSSSWEHDFTSSPYEPRRGSYLIGSIVAPSSEASSSEHAWWILSIVILFEVDVWKISLPFAVAKLIFDSAWDHYRFTTEKLSHHGHLDSKEETSADDDDDSMYSQIPASDDVADGRGSAPKGNTHPYKCYSFSSSCGQKLAGSLNQII
ncbi:hypothetical protein C8J55DRAFT_564042 [Lentinula edodes]|uniref:Uncharacterized protein n=1 Tax=Lentinula lateritia TaxID=40482 RepID=A0A9W9DIG7_9AGAR|nr:hypothetical protein C8J55DRAFT_564042 [Lentinula edodes]